MTQDEALDLIRTAADQAKAGSASLIGLDTHLVDDDVLDSLDVMAFLFELETLRGGKLEAIGEDFTDFRVQRLIDLLRASG